METKTLPEGYLQSCSIEALESLVLARKNAAANLLGETRSLLQRWVQADIDARLAEWMLAMRRSQALREGGSVELPAQPSESATSRALLGAAEDCASGQHPAAPVPPGENFASALLPVMTAAQIVFHSHARDKRPGTSSSHTDDRGRKNAGASRAFADLQPASVPEHRQVYQRPLAVQTPRDTRLRPIGAPARGIAEGDLSQCLKAEPLVELHEAVDLLPADDAIASAVAMNTASAADRAIGRRGRMGRRLPVPVRPGSLPLLRAARASSMSGRGQKLLTGRCRLASAS